MSEEQKLLQSASELNTKALAEIYDTFSPGIYRYAMRLLGDVTLAEDCVSETFARFLKSLQERRGPRDNLQAYLYRIAHNWIVDHYRKDGKTVELSDVLRSEADVPEVEAAKHIRQEQVREAIRQLTPDQQRVILLKYLEDWSNEEVARAMKKPIGAVKSIQHRALKSLYRFLAEKRYLLKKLGERVSQPHEPLRLSSRARFVTKRGMGGICFVSATRSRI